MHRQTRSLHLICGVTALAGLSLLRPLAAPQAYPFGAAGVSDPQIRFTGGRLVSHHPLAGMASGAT